MQQLLNGGATCVEVADFIFQKIQRLMTDSRLISITTNDSLLFLFMAE